MLVAINDIATRSNKSYPAIHYRVLYYGIPVKDKLMFEKESRYRNRHYHKKFIDEKYVRFIIGNWDKRDLVDIIEKWYEASTDDLGLLYAYEQELKTMWKNDLMRFCIKKELI